MDQKRILIVEGDDALRTMLFTILRHQPLDVDTAATYDAAISHILVCDYAVILVDLSAGEPNGAAFLRDFREKRPDATSFVIGVTEDVSESFEPNTVNVLLQKPFEISSLAEAVRECALIVPPSEDLEQGCPPPESDTPSKLDESGTFYMN